MRSLDSTTVTKINATAKYIAYLLEIDLPNGSTALYAQAHDNITFNSLTYTAKNFDFQEGPHNAVLDYGDQPVVLANEEGAPSALIATNDLRGLGCRVKGIFLSASMAPINTDYLDIIDGIIEKTSATRETTTLTVRSRLCLLEKKVPVRNFGSTCPWVFGSGDCGFILASTAITSAQVDAGCTATVIADAARTEATDYWKDGVVTFTSGNLDGITGRILSSASGSLTLEHALSEAPATNDYYNVQQGCDKQYSTCQSRSRTASFRGFASMPREIVKE